MTDHLYRVWFGWSTESDGNRNEMLRILATSFRSTLKFAKEQMVKPEYHEDLEETDFGYMWDEKPDTCDCEDDEDHFCYTSYYIELDEIEDYTEDDLSLNLLTETLGSMNAFHDIRPKYPITCIRCQSYLGEYSSNQEVEDAGHYIADDPTDVSGLAVICVECEERYSA